MLITSKELYDSLIHGAQNVIKNREILNKINVFPVRDGDTGSNLASMMRTIIQKSEHSNTVKKTLESIADAALYGARGNSGIIFAQYFRGLSETITDGEVISIFEYASASKVAAQYAYNALEQPVEGTMITIMREWGTALAEEVFNKKTLEEIFSDALKRIERALEKTKEQLPVLKKANVVDSGAKGFTFFMEGVLYFIANKEELNFTAKTEGILDVEESYEEIVHDHVEGCRYCTECFIENSDQIYLDAIKNDLSGKGNSIVVAGNQRKARIHIHTNDPAEIFDYLRDKGVIVYQKVDDMYSQEVVVNNRKAEIALITDSIADLPQTMIDEYQIQVIHLDILCKEVSYLDKLTIHPARLLEISRHDKELPTSSQPSPKLIENMLDYLSTYYKSIIVMTVSKELSGTYHNFISSVKNFNKKDYKISVINTRQNSGAQGLLVKKCAQYIQEGLPHDVIVKRIEEEIAFSKILVQVRTLDNMIKSGRLSVKAGILAKKTGMKPIITLDSNGKGILDGIAFSLKASNRKLVNHIQRMIRTDGIDQYNIVHVNNEAGAKELAQIMTKVIGFEPVYITQTSSIVAVSAGEGAVAISYLRKKREI